MFTSVSHDSLADLWAVVFPDVSRAVGILEVFLRGCPVVADGDVRGTLVGI